MLSVAMMTAYARWDETKALLSCLRDAGAFQIQCWAVKFFPTITRRITSIFDLISRTVVSVTRNAFGSFMKIGPVGERAIDRAPMIAQSALLQERLLVGHKLCWAIRSIIVASTNQEEREGVNYNRINTQLSEIFRTVRSELYCTTLMDRGKIIMSGRVGNCYDYAMLACCLYPEGRIVGSRKSDHYFVVIGGSESINPLADPDAVVVDGWLNIVCPAAEAIALQSQALLPIYQQSNPRLVQEGMAHLDDISYDYQEHQRRNCGSVEKLCREAEEQLEKVKDSFPEGTFAKSSEEIEEEFVDFLFHGQDNEPRPNRVVIQLESEDSANPQELLYDDPKAQLIFIEIGVPLEVVLGDRQELIAWMNRNELVKKKFFDWGQKIDEYHDADWAWALGDQEFAKQLMMSGISLDVLLRFRGWFFSNKALIAGKMDNFRQLISGNISVSFLHSLNNQQLGKVFSDTGKFLELKKELEEECFRGLNNNFLYWAINNLDEIHYGVCTAGSLGFYTFHCLYLRSPEAALSEVVTSNERYRNKISKKGRNQVTPVAEDIS